MDIRLSTRIQGLAPSATLAAADKARALRERGVEVISFGAGEPEFDTPESIKRAAVDALSAGDTKYPAPVSGKTPLRAAICEYLQKHCQIAYEPAQVCVTVGAKDALFLAFSALLDPGDEVIIPVPYWVSYPDQVRFVGGVPVFLPGDPENAGKISADMLRGAITPRTRALVINSPCNPTGAVYSRAELGALAAALRGTPVIAVSDEIYHRLQFEAPPGPSFAAIEGMLERTLVVNGMSKSFAMTGWRLGFAAGPQPLIDAMTRLQGQTTSGPASFIQTASRTALLGDQECVERMCRAYRERGARMCAGLNELPGVRCSPPRGAFYCFPDVSGTFAQLGVSNADGFAEAVLDHAHVAVVSGAPFGCPGHARLSFAASDAHIDEGLRRVAKLLRRG
jgi:aspartate aminotransferase